MPAPTRTPTRNGRERRHWMRVAPDKQTGIALYAGNRRYDCRVENVSLSGIMLRLTPQAMPEGEVRLEHPSAGTFTGTAAWRRGGTLGIAFPRPERELDRALQCVSLIMAETPEPASR